MSAQEDVPPMVDDNDEVVRYDDLISTTDGVNPLIDDNMRAYLDQVLGEEARKYNAELQGTDIVADMVDAPSMELDEELLKQLDEQEALAEAQELQAQAEAEAQAQAQAASAPVEEDDGFQVARKGKKGTKHAPKPVAPTTTSSSSSTAPIRQAASVRKMGGPEERPKMPGNSSFPFCFNCSLRHDFDECQLDE